MNGSRVSGGRFFDSYFFMVIFLRHRLLCPLIFGFLTMPLRGEIPVDNTLADSASRLLSRAVENQYRGGYSAEVVFVRDSFLRGKDSLVGRLNFDDAGGERELSLKGRDEAFEWWSRNFGQEQWWKDESNERLHRVPYRSFKKPAFASLLTFEDLIKFPAEYLVDFKSCQSLSETDSTYDLILSMKSFTRSRYGSLAITLKKKPVLLSRVVFFAADGRRLKSLEVPAYRQTEGGYIPAGIRVFNSDSLVSLQISLSHPTVIPIGKDKTSAPTGMNAMGGRPARQTDIVPSEGAEAP